MDLQTRHRLIVSDARNQSAVKDASVALVATSPPYPMIEMWDEVFAAMAPASVEALRGGRPRHAFELMHQELDRVWAECHRVLIPGGIMAINIGDATRTVDEEFQLYPNHARILQKLMALDMAVLPDILWRKPNNSPTKFLGSGMLPPGAYVTYEHEYILLARKGTKRAFPKPADKALRGRSAYFWEERNVWFSDLWMNLLGVRQKLEAEAPLFAENPGELAAVDEDLRERSAAFPLELALRLIRMFSVEGDCVLDPFVGTGTSMQAAAIAGRSSIGLDIAAALAPSIAQSMRAAPGIATGDAERRRAAHRAFVAERVAADKPLKYEGSWLKEPVMTRQEIEIRWPNLRSIRSDQPLEWIAAYE